MKGEKEKKVISKRLLGREPLGDWGKFSELVKVEVANLLHTGRELGNSRMKFLARTIEQVVKAKLNNNLKDLTSVKRSFATELKQEGVTDCEKQKKIIRQLWVIISKNANLYKSKDPFIKERIAHISRLIALYQSGEICFGYQKLVREHNLKITELNESYRYLSVKRIKPTKSAMSQMSQMSQMSTTTGKFAEIF